MTTNFFKTLDYVLSQTIEDICRHYQIKEDEAIGKVRDFLKENSAAYYSDNPNLKYDDPLCRVAYLYAYVGAHANLIDNAFYKFPDFKDFVKQILSQNGILNVCSLGGGPGSELLGFVKFIERIRTPDNYIDINFSLIDNIPQWDETWQKLVNGLEEKFKADYSSSSRQWPVVVHRSFLTLDLTKPDDFRYLISRFRNVQIYILNHTVSELLAKREEFGEVFKILVERSCDGAYFLFIDRNQEEVLELVKLLLKVDDLLDWGVQTEEKTMDSDEQKTDMGKWLELMEWAPKVKWNAFYALAQKLIMPF